MIRKNKQSGFTLIEVLIAVAIIAILASMMYVGFTAAFSRDRDTQRKHDIRAIAAAIELYKQDYNSFPVNAIFENNPQMCGQPWQIGSTVYLGKVPCDPSTGKPYDFDNLGQSYTITACLENPNDPQRDVPINDGGKNCSGFSATYTISSE